MNIRHATDNIQDIRDAVQARASDLMSIDDELIKRQRWLKANGGACVQSIEVQRDGTVHGETQSVITIAPIFDEGDIWVGLGGGSGHRAMIPPLADQLAL